MEYINIVDRERTKNKKTEDLKMKFPKLTCTEEKTGERYKGLEIVKMAWSNGNTSYKAIDEYGCMIAGAPSLEETKKKADESLKPLYERDEVVALVAEKGAEKRAAWKAELAKRDAERLAKAEARKKEAEKVEKKEEKIEEEGKKEMKFTAEELFEIAKEEYAAAGRGEEGEGWGLWAYYAAVLTYDSEEEVRKELRDHIAKEKEAEDLRDDKKKKSFFIVKEEYAAAGLEIDDDAAAFVADILADDEGDEEEAREKVREMIEKAKGK